ncbi:MAG TPA: hypothetical protein VJ809_02045 [Pirellulales bacterium]|nr:hypothetical protein [Pirellulales bacterium]
MLVLVVGFSIIRSSHFSQRRHSSYCQKAAHIIQIPPIIYDVYFGRGELFGVATLAFFEQFT